MSCTHSEIAHAFEIRKPLYQEEGILNKERCGTFWTMLMGSLPSSSRGTGEGYPTELFDLLYHAESFYMEVAGDAVAALHLDECFAKHHQRYSLLTPDLERLKASVRNLAPYNREYNFTFIYRDLITASFPEPGQWWNCDTLCEMDEERLLAAVYKRNPKLAIRMWRLLLDTVGEQLKNKDVARRLLSIETAGPCNRTEAWGYNDRFDPILDELERDEKFARQFYQSAVLPSDQTGLLVVCCARGRIALMEHLRELILQSPYFESLYPRGIPKWMQYLPENDANRKRTRTKPTTVTQVVGEQNNDTTEYCYCHVAIEGARQIYPYLCEDPTIVPGDYVRVPLGRNDTERIGLVKRVGLYTISDAPCPPDKAKMILGRGEQPATIAPTPVVLQPKSTPYPIADEPAPIVAEVMIPSDNFKVMLSVNTGQEENQIQTTAVTKGVKIAETEKHCDSVAHLFSPDFVKKLIVEEAQSPTHKPNKHMGTRCFMIALLIMLPILLHRFFIWQQEETEKRESYQSAMVVMTDGDYKQAQNLFEDMPQYHDSADLAIYCKYAALYTSQDVYTEGEEELSSLELYYDTDLQPQIDALVLKVSEMAEQQRLAEEEAAEQQRQDELRARYGGKLPNEGMLMSNLHYTILGNLMK